MPDVESILRTYFDGEKSEAMLILLTGVACLVAVFALWFWAREPFAKGLAAALLIVAALGLGVGGTVYFRTDAQVQRLVEQQQHDAAKFTAEEGPRMRQVVRSFGQYRLAYAAAAVLALALVFLFGRPAAYGFAVGLLLLAALGFTIDFYAERRALDYVAALEARGILPVPP